MQAIETSLSIRSRIALAAALGACLLAAALLVNPNHAGSAPLRVTVMGKSVDAPQPAGCSAEGHVTGFQSRTSDGAVRPFEATAEGKIVSWSISLSDPAKEDDGGTCKRFFYSLFGRLSTARISVLKLVSEDPVKYKLVRQAPLETLNPYFGSTPQFVLEHPLTVLRGQVVALTVPTWAPMFAPTGLGIGDDWRGSRVKGKCSYPDPKVVPFEQVKAFADSSFSQQKPGSTKQYTCYYDGSRLLYTATFVKKPGA